MSIRLDPRRVGVLKRLAAEAGMRPGDLVRQWTEERIDAARAGEGGMSLDDRLRALDERIAALEASAGTREAADAAAPAAAGADPAPAEGPPAPEAAPKEAAPPARRRGVSATPSGRVALHEEMIAVLGERGPMTAGELASAIAERGRYTPPRSGKPLDAAMVSQRASNPTYRSRFRRAEGRIGLAG